MTTHLERQDTMMQFLDKHFKLLAEAPEEHELCILASGTNGRGGFEGQFLTDCRDSTIASTIIQVLESAPEVNHMVATYFAMQAMAKLKGIVEEPESSALN